jgi:uncharacterized coiled-coil DUF342 family protein
MMSAMDLEQTAIKVAIDTDEAVATLMALRAEIEETASRLRALRDEANLTAAAMTKAAAEAKAAAEQLEAFQPVGETGEEAGDE